MSRAFFKSTGELQIERNGNANSNERFTVSALGVSAKGEELGEALGKLADKLGSKADAYSRLPSETLSQTGATEKALLLDLFGIRDGL